MASMFKNKRTTLERVEKFISPLYFTDANLYGKLYNESIKLSGLYCCNLPAKEKMTFSQVLEQGEFVEVKIGESFGPTWATHWFRVDVEIPESWEGKEVHLRWNSNSEAMVWSDNGIPLQGLSGGLENQLRENFIITRCASVEEFHKVFYIEMACNTAFGAGSTGLISPPCPNQYFTLKLAEIAVFDRKVYGLLVDLEVLLGMVKYLPSESSQAYEALYAANEMVNTIVPGCRETYQKAEEIAHTFFSQRNGDRQHVIMAVGNCHIDCAWLWPFSETIRKCGRSWSSTVRLMEEYPNFYFACSQAQQFSWVKEYYPALYEQIRTYVSKGQFIPVGGSWVEMDGNIPSGEAFIRQFLYGQKFFQEEFGITCKELWLPDTFGFSAQLPQIMRHCGMTNFLTQKLSWNLVNRFPHNNFFWQGIDGSTVLTHLPPGDSYEMKVTVEEAIKTFQNLQDKGRVSCSLMLFGYGDGGGGPTLDMLERQKRLVNVDGVPRVQLSTPQNFFDCLENSSNNLCFWVGDLYLELHNATYTTQAVIKSMNRKCEFALRRTEILLSILMAEKKEPKTDYPSLKLENIWKTLLLTQFHDVLPGTSINKVNEEAFKMLNDVFDCAAELENVAALELFGEFDNN
ncbi:alpha-mannosidase 2C1-like [Limulus polyphemus]|uniref:Alpha-mannosidase 2C1-like n=1 Tax=Limulus polyphemus TaxID=6850 RepID=A0ABM1BLK6_LIMPO|nr:alpha-mannosidase 2C1-like [Limulus polyphemus]XP_022252611.1 alpha-mannosidase 2C1-like [Limulus polyphemus]XP_022252612.1 alpha-mannosidase 2C1-like [Limulus polyphemus]